MNRKLLALDIALGAGVIFGGFQLHSQWTAAKVRQAGMPGPPPTAAQPAPLPPLPTPTAVLASGYQDVATHDLFDATRNPNVPVDPPPAPPPPKEPPPLPSFHGMVDFGDKEGPVALITPADEPRHREVHKGEMIGEFKLLAFDRQEMTLDWEGKVIHKRLGDAAAPQQQARGQAAAPEPMFKQGVIPGVAQGQDNAPREQARAEAKGPGPSVNDTTRVCQANDTSPSGTVVDGYRKIVVPSPMGPKCFWTSDGK